MKKVLTARIGSRHIVVPKLVGLLLVLVSVLAFIASTADLVVSWDKIKDVKNCLNSTQSMSDRVSYLICTTKALAAGVYPFAHGIDPMDVWAVMGQKAAAWTFWVLVLVIALVIYQTGKLIEVEEEVLEAEKEKEEKPRRRTRRSKK